MDALTIRRMHVRYHLPGATADDRDRLRGRLDGVVADALGSTLEAALERAGLATSDEICIRSLVVPVRLRLAGADAALAIDWSVAMTTAMAEAIDRGGDDVVRYRSLSHAILDLAAGVIAGDERRAWAWDQLGIWDARTAPGGGNMERLVRALLRAPASVVPVLVELARGEALAIVAPRISPRQWSRLALAALSAADAPVGPVSSGDRPAASLARRAERTVRDSALAPSLTAVIRTVPAADHPGLVQALAALIALESDPGSVASARSGPTFRAAVGEALLGLTAPADEPVARTSSKPPTSPSGAGRAPHPKLERPRHLSVSPPILQGAEPERRVDASGAVSPGDASHPSANDSTPAPRADGQAEAGAPASAPLPRAPSAVGGPVRDVVDSDAERVGIASSLGFRQSTGRTRFGGLLFLLHVARRIDLATEVESMDALRDRPMRWVMHMLAMALLPISETDPAGLAFAGLRPDAAPPSTTEPAASPAELGAIAVLVARIVSALVELLERPGEPATTLLRSVCRRRAEIVADAGWIDVRLGLDERTIEARRAGLDLDPGYVSWLGVALRFTYV